jgi:hypothetical protein
MISWNSWPEGNGRLCWLRPSFLEHFCLISSSSNFSIAMAFSSFVAIHESRLRSHKCTGF